MHLQRVREAKNLQCVCSHRVSSRPRTAIGRYDRQDLPAGRYRKPKGTSRAALLFHSPAPRDGPFLTTTGSFCGIVIRSLAFKPCAVYWKYRCYYRVIIQSTRMLLQYIRGPLCTFYRAVNTSHCNIRDAFCSQPTCSTPSVHQSEPLCEDFTFSYFSNAELLILPLLPVHVCELFLALSESLVFNLKWHSTEVYTSRWRCVCFSFLMSWHAVPASGSTRFPAMYRLRTSMLVALLTGVTRSEPTTSTFRTLSYSSCFKRLDQE